MTDLRTAAQQALEALETPIQEQTFMQKQNAITALEAALAEPVQGAGVTLKPVLYAPRRLTDEEVEGVIKRQRQAEPVLNPAPGYCKHCKQYTIEEPLPAEPVQPVAWMWEHQLNDLKHYGYKPNMRAWTTEGRLGSFEGLVPLYTAP